MKCRKDVKVRREWDSLERIIIDEGYVPEPTMIMLADGSDAYFH